MKCRFCNTDVSHVFVDLVSSPPSNSFLTQKSLNEPEVFYPLKVQVCKACFLVQIDEYKKSDTIFNNEYVYFSSYSSSWLLHAEQYVNDMVGRFGFNSNSRVIEIASNDGYLLQYFHQRNIPVLGIEPTANTAVVAKERGIESIIDFFGVRLANELAKQNIKADLLLGNNVLAHVPDINDFVDGMSIVLQEKGIITMEFPHLLKLIEYVQFDTIYHEHFSYLSLITVKQIFEAHKLKIFDVQEIPTHGGSLRIFACHENDFSKNQLPAVAEIIQKEKDFGLSNINAYTDFQKKVEIIKDELISFLISAKKKGKKVAAYGAAAKGNTLLNFCGIKPDLIAFVVDRNPHKQNKYLPGSHIPVFDESQLIVDKPNYVIIFPWNIKNEVIEQLTYVKEWGGEFVTIIPTLQLL